MAEKIKFINNCALGSLVEIEGLISKIEKKKKQNGEDYLMLTITDKEDDLVFPIWDEVESRYEKLEVGKILTVIGNVSEYDSHRQIRVSKLGIRNIEDDERCEFIPSYEIRQADIDCFINTINQLKEPYKTIVTEAIGVVGSDKWQRFMMAPAAVRHHHNKLGGLFIHTYGVTMAAINMLSNYTEFPFCVNANNVINWDRVVSAAMLHDVCKREEYTYDTVIGYGDSKFDHRIKFLPYIEILNSKLKSEGKPYLDDKELEALQELVLCHHGPWGGYKPKNIESMIVFLADMVDSQIVGCAESNDPKTRMTISSMMDAE